LSVNGRTKTAIVGRVGICLSQADSSGETHLDDLALPFVQPGQLGERLM